MEDATVGQRPVKISTKAEHDNSFRRIFGNQNPKTMEEFLLGGEKEIEEYERYAFEKNMGIKYNKRLFADSEKIIFIDYLYEAGGILLTGAKSNMHPDTLILAINDTGEVSNESEKLGMNMPLNYIDRQLVFIPKASISGFSISQHLCSNPDCRNCSKNRDLGEELLPYTVYIFNSGGSNIFDVPTLFIAGEIISEISTWQGRQQKTLRIKKQNHEN